MLLTTSRTKEQLSFLELLLVVMVMWCVCASWGCEEERSVVAVAGCLLLHRMCDELIIVERHLVALPKQPTTGLLLLLRGGVFIMRMRVT